MCYETLSALQRQDRWPVSQCTPGFTQALNNIFAKHKVSLRLDNKQVTAWDLLL